LDSFSPHAGQSSLYELCLGEDKDGIVTENGRWLVKSALKPNEYWIDEPESCMLKAIGEADASGLPYPENERMAAHLFSECKIDQKSTFEALLRCGGSLTGLAFVFDGFRRIRNGSSIGAPETILGLVIGAFSIFA